MQYRVRREQFQSQPAFAKSLTVEKGGQLFTRDAGAPEPCTLTTDTCGCGVGLFPCYSRQFVRPAVEALAEARGTAGAPR